MKSTTLRKLEGKWYFVSEGEKSNPVHDISNGERVGQELAGRVLEVGDMHRTAGLWDPQDATRMGGSIPRSDWAAWQRIASAIDAGKYAPLTIPITPLRDLCSFLRLTDPVGNAVKLAERWCSHPRELAQLFMRSVEDFDEYDNDEPFAKMTATRGQASVAEGGGFARAVARVSHRGLLHIHGAIEPLSYVAHELSPRRTTGGRRAARFEGQDDDDGTNSSGAGGLDLLLATASTAVVGEVKSSTDTSVSFAVLQSLMYTAELVSMPQRKRLSRHFEGLCFLDSSPPPWFDVVIICEARVDTDLSLAHRLAKTLLADDSLDARRVQRLVRRIDFVEGVQSSEGVDLRFVASTSSAGVTT